MPSLLVTFPHLDPSFLHLYYPPFTLLLAHILFLTRLLINLVDVVVSIGAFLLFCCFCSTGVYLDYIKKTPLFWFLFLLMPYFLYFFKWGEGLQSINSAFLTAQGDHWCSRTPLVIYVVSPTVAYCLYWPPFIVSKQIHKRLWAQVKCI